MLQKEIEKISVNNFSQYGELVNKPDTVPTARSDKFKFWSDLAHYDIGGKSEIGICTVFLQTKLIIEELERHNSSPEILIPGDGPFLIPLLLNQNDTSEIDIFRVEIGQAIIINKGVWHGACLPVGKKETSYFVIFEHGTPTKDVEKKSIQPVEVLQ
ncbi:MAG: ureidoglycolate lyase [Candidatus Marinimicrobia bacterium]|nr:ureidoglycolate lyase [Candidatus Neomarinimicrobiota bacterium]